MRDAIAAAPERWRWRRAGAGELRAVDAAFRDWFAELEYATASRWQSGSLGATDPGNAVADTLQLWFDGRLHATLRLNARGIELEPAAGSAARQHAALPAASAAALRDALDALTR